ncbi:MAG: hypothetical protein JSS30_03590 [Verrucomicrobia bacterium]|nr:hypothetical protein [Verrucomicrobiota bacterium]
MAAPIPASTLFPVDPTNRFYEQDKRVNQARFRTCERWMGRALKALPVIVGGAAILQTADVKSVWIDAINRHWLVGSLTTTALIAAGFFYTRYNLVSLSSGPKLNESNALPKVTARQFLKRIEAVEQAKLLEKTDRDTLKEAKECLNGYISRREDPIYLPPSERATVKPLLEKFEALETRLNQKGMTKGEIGALLVTVKGCIDENEFAKLHRNKKPLAQAVGPEQVDLRRFANLDPDAPCPEIKLSEDKWTKTLSLIEARLEVLRGHVAAEDPNARVILPQELVELKERFDVDLQQATQRKEKVQRIRGYIIKLLKNENVDLRQVPQQMQTEWKQIAKAVLSHKRQIDDEQTILELSYSFLQDLN